MPFEYKKVSTPPNKSIVINFDNPLVFYIAGIAYYSLTYGRGDEQVQEIGLSLGVNQPSPKQLLIQVTGVLQDSSGNGIDPTQSKVDVVVLAWTGTNPGNLLLQGAADIVNGGQSVPIPLPGATFDVLQTVLTGFDLAYSPTQQSVLYQGTGVSALQSGSNGYVLGQATMGDSSGNHASIARVGGGLIAISSGTATNVGFQVLANQQTTNQVSATFPNTVRDAAVLIINGYARYSSGARQIQTAGAGTTGWSVSGKTVNLNNAQAFMRDAGGETQDDTQSSVSLLVVGFY
jgi:hypothetical protein